MHMHWPASVDRSCLNTALETPLMTASESRSTRSDLEQLAFLASTPPSLQWRGHYQSLSVITYSDEFTYHSVYWWPTYTINNGSIASNTSKLPLVILIREECISCGCKDVFIHCYINLMKLRKSHDRVLRLVLMWHLRLLSVEFFHFKNTLIDLNFKTKYIGNCFVCVFGE